MRIDVARALAPLLVPHIVVRLSHVSFIVLAVLAAGTKPASSLAG
jgi:hypothetical protein